MIRLPNTGTYSLELVTAQNGAQVVVCYSDATSTSYSGGIQTTAIVSATTTTIASTPAASTVRDIDEINIKNTFAGSHTITVQIDANGTNYPLVTASLLTDESLNYTHGSGWQAKDANGNTKSTPLTAMTSAQLAGIITDGTGTGGALMFANSPTMNTPVVIGLVDLSNAASGQIKFPATQNASADVNTLDDYEEGTFTPTITFITAGDLSVAYSLQVGGYVKIGKLVTLTIVLTTTTFTHTTASGNFRILGNPFTPENVTNEQWMGAISLSGYTASTTYTSLTTLLSANSNIITVRGSGSGILITTLTSADLPTGGNIILRLTTSFFAA